MMEEGGERVVLAALDQELWTEALMNRNKKS
jgi:hypothetical protein